METCIVCCGRACSSFKRLKENQTDKPFCQCLLHCALAETLQYTGPYFLSIYSKTGLKRPLIILFGCLILVLSN